MALMFLRYRWVQSVRGGAKASLEGYERGQRRNLGGRNELTFCAPTSSHRYLALITAFRAPLTPLA
jgi:hypothetical protein